MARTRGHVSLRALQVTGIARSSRRPAGRGVVLHMFLEKFDAAQAHRETYVAVIKSVLREPGAKQALAEKLGRKPQHLSNMLNPGTNAETYTRTPNPRTSERLVALLPLEPEVRASLLEHLYRAWEGERGALRPYTYTSGRALTHYTIADLLGEIGQAHVEATHAVDPTEAKRKYRVLRHACKRVLERIDPDPARVDSDDLDFNANPLEFAQVCLFVHDVQCVFNRADDALVHAKYARGVMDACDPTRFRKRGEYFGHLRVNAVVAECLAYRNLGLHREAIAASYEAEALVEETGGAGAEFWLPDICLHRLNALIRTPRFTLSDVRGLVGRAEREYEGRARRAGRAGRAAEPHLRWRVQLLEGEARAYLEY